MAGDTMSFTYPFKKACQQKHGRRFITRNRALFSCGASDY